MPTGRVGPWFPSLFPNKRRFSSSPPSRSYPSSGSSHHLYDNHLLRALALFIVTASAALGSFLRALPSSLLLFPLLWDRCETCASRSSLMRVEAAQLVPESDGRISSGSKSAKKKRRQKKQVSSTKTTVRRLFEACEEVFSDGRPGIVPSAGDVEKIRSVLDSMKPSDVNLTPNMLYFGNSTATMGSTAVTYIHLYECNKFSIGIFCLPASSVIPLHNHPGMTVFSKLLFGSMHIKSYDWADVSLECNGRDTHDACSLYSEPRLAKVKTDAVFKAPCKTSILYPSTGGNIHCFSAITPCAVLDVLGPPYCEPEGRHCAYYRDFHYTCSPGDLNQLLEDEKYAWLEEIERPDDFLVLGAKYRGPQILDHC